MITEHKNGNSQIKKILHDFLKLDGAVQLPNLPRATQLYGAGSSCDWIYLLNEGKVKISAEGAGGRQCLLHIVEAGELFGEAGLLGESFHIASAETLERSVVSMVPLNSVLNYSEKTPSFCLYWAPLIGRRLRRVEEQLEWISLLEVEQRIARLMLRCAEGNSGRGPIELEFSQKDLAGLVGATRETVSGALNRLRRDGCIDIRRRRVLILSLGELRERIGETGSPAADERILQAAAHAAE